MAGILARAAAALAVVLLLAAVPAGADTAPTAAVPTASPAGVPGPADPQGPAYVRDLLPVAVLALVVGGVAGFELSRRGL